MNLIDSRKVVGALLIDLSETFDSVSHQTLFTDLLATGCSSRIVQWFHSYFSQWFHS